jgi:uncharacterized coiled-coil protein SlyX
MIAYRRFLHKTDNSIAVILLVCSERERGGDIVTTKKNLIIVVLATFCLTTSMLAIRSYAGWPYDPWSDINDDGKIRIDDVLDVASRFGTDGEAINKTALLLDLQAKIDSLNASLLDLEAYFETRINTLNATLVEQQSRIADLETKLTILNATKLGVPDYDSLRTEGWIWIQPGNTRTLTHDLHTTDVLVYMVGYDYDGYEFHQINYGGEADNLITWGAWWCKLTITSIEIDRLSSDGRWDVIRVLIWKIPQ